MGVKVKTYKSNQAILAQKAQAVGNSECFATEILDAKYEKTDVAEVVKGLTHLNAHQKADLLRVLQENDKMFDGTLGVYPQKKVHIDIDPNAKPVHSRPYPVP